MSSSRTRAIAAIAAAVVVPAVAVALAAPASAAYTPSPECSSATGAHTPGSAITLTGIGFTPGQSVTVGGLGGAVVLHRTVTADSNGSVSVREQLGTGLAQFTLSGTKLSAHCGLISVEGTGVTKRVTPVKVAPVAVAPVAVKATTVTAPTRVLAFTGAAHLGEYSALGGGLLLLGGGLFGLGTTAKPPRRGAHRA